MVATPTPDIEHFFITADMIFMFVKYKLIVNLICFNIREI